MDDRLAAFLTTGKELDQTLTLVGLADVLGYELVLDNHILNRDGLMQLAQFGTVTSNAKLGTGVYPAFTMTPVILGQQAASLDELVDGRLVLGIGTSHRPVIENFHGLEFPSSPLTAMREYLTILRSLFRDGSVQFEGEVYRAQFSFQGFTPRADIPLMIAALGPKMCQLAGELADGVMLWLCNPDYIRDVVVPNVAEGAARAGRDPSEIEIIPAITCALTDDPGPALDALRKSLVTYMSLPFYRSMLANSGFQDDLDAFDAGMQAGDFPAALAAMSEPMLRSLAGIGSPEDVRAKIEEYRQAGASLPGVGPLTAPGTLGTEKVLLAAAGREVAGA